MFEGWSEIFKKTKIPLEQDKQLQRTGITNFTSALKTTERTSEALH